MESYYSNEFDFEDFDGKPNKIICVYFIPKSGSTFFANKMRETNRLGFPLEYFAQENILKLQERMPDISASNILPIIKKRTSPNGVFGFKWNASYGQTYPPNLKPDYRLLLDRHDRKAQARSFCLSEFTGNWFKSSESDYNPPANDIKKTIQRLTEVRTSTLNMIGTNTCKVIYFEDLIKDSSKIIAEILEGALGLNLPEPKKRLRKKTVTKE